MSASPEPPADPATRLDQPADRALIGPARRGAAALAVFVVLLAVGGAAWLNIRTPAPLGTDAPVEKFSAERAYQHVQVIAAEPHVTGSPANDRVREHLVRTLRGLGLTTEVQDTVGDEAGQLSGAAGGATMAHVRNVVARLPGTDPTGRVFLVAHYDSVQVGPGGNDDAVGSSAILEVARALTAGPRPRNDVLFVLTDAEEACLCGAAAFAASHPLAADGGVVLNLEARGSTGPAVMFETSERNAGLVQVFGRAAPHPIGTSFAVEIYRLLPNDTDFTAFLGEGFTGLNSAYIDGAAVYHTPLDTPESVDRGSLQHHGDNTLALAREFGAIDLAALDADTDATYFPVPGGLIHYSGVLIWPLALLAVGAVGALGWLARRRGRTTWPRIAAGFSLTALPIIAAPLAAYLLWTGITALRPGYALLLDPYRPLWYRWAVLALAAAVLLTWYALSRRLGPAALAIGGLGWLAGFGVLLASAAPGGAYLTTLPALAGALGGLIALMVRPAGGWATVAVTTGASVGVLILLPTVLLLFPALGMGMGGVAALVGVLLGLAALPVLELLYPAADRQPGMPTLRARSRAALPALAAGLATLVFAGVGLAVDRFDTEHPIPTHLMYALDADTGQAHWLSGEPNPQPWTAQYVSDSVPVPTGFPVLGDGPYLAGPAEAAALPAPALTVLADTTSGDERTLRLQLTPQRPVRVLSLHVETSAVTVRRAMMAGRPVPIEPISVDDEPAVDEPTTDPAADRWWGFGLVFHAPPPEGIEIELVFRTTGGEVLLRAMDASDGLAGLPGFRPRPPEVGIIGSHSSEMVGVARTYRLPPPIGG